MTTIPLISLIIVPLAVFGSPLNETIDLTWDFSEETIYWTGIRNFSYTKKVGNEQDRGYWYAMNEFCAGEHGGTHFDAPYHFYKEGWKVAEVPVSRLITKGTTLDLSAEKPNLVLPAHLENWEKINGAFEENSVLLIRFGWSENWPNRTKYFGLDSDNKPTFPALSKEGAEWIGKSGKIVGVGLDVPSVDPGTSTDFMSHRILSKNQIYVLENVKLIMKLPPKGFTLVVLPMKLEEGTGAPVRIVALP